MVKRNVEWKRIQENPQIDVTQIYQTVTETFASFSGLRDTLIVACQTTEHPLMLVLILIYKEASSFFTETQKL